MGFSRESLNQWLVAVIVHFILFQIAGELREKSAVIPEMEISSNTSLERGPSNRLVFIVIEGLRWDVFNTKANISNFSIEMMKRGKAGPMYVNIPSNGYRGLLRMTTGVPGNGGSNETANVFQSTRTVYIGPNSLQKVFNINESHCYPEAWENLTVSPNQTKGDEWVFKRWSQLLSAPGFNSQGVNMFFFYLNGFAKTSQLDGPFSYRAIKELKYILDDLELVYRNSEKFFHDSKTSYVVTSDYGFIAGKGETDNVNDTMVPLITWGAGLASSNQIKAEESSRLIRKGFVRQEDLTSLISYLMGTTIPYNNFGDAPIIRLSYSEDRAKLLLLNAEQLTELFLNFEKAYGFGLARFCSPLNKYYIETYMTEIEQLLLQEDYYSSIYKSQELIELALRGISYYRNYESNILWICALIGLIGWTAVTLGWVVEKVKMTPIIQREMAPEGQENIQQNTKKNLTIFQRFFTPLFVVHTICFIMFCGTIGILMFISAPFITSLAAILAVTISWLAAKSCLDWIRLYKSLSFNNVKIKKEKPLMYLIYFVVFTCFLSYPIVIQVMLSFAIMFSALSDLRYSTGQHLAYWMLSSLSYLILLHYPFDTPYLPVLLIAAMVWIVAGGLFLHCLKVHLLDWPIFLVAFLSIALISIHSQYGPPTPGNNLMLRWTPMILISFVPVIGSSFLPVRLFQLCLCLSIPVFLSSLSFEPISFLVILSHIFSWALLEGYPNISELISSTLHFSVTSTSITWADVRITYYFLSYVLTSFLVIGNSCNIYNWPNEWSSYFGPISSLNVFIIVSVKSLPVILIENIFLAVLEKTSSVGYQSVILHLSSHASLINFALIPESSITLYNQLMFLFSLLMRPLAYFFLMPSILSLLIDTSVPRTTQGRSPEIRQTDTVETSL